MDLTKRERTGLIAFAIIIISVISFVYFSNNSKDTIQVISKEDSAVEGSKNIGKSKEISIYICGEINKPGVYTLNEGDRLIKLIGMAGGFTEKADSESVNLAAKLLDEDFIKIPSKIVSGSDISLSGTNLSSTNSNGKININSASKEQLETLPRIGEAIAQRIIDYRENTGRFKDIKDIMNVSGIGDKIFENIKDKITVH
jgi:competence protein ComEA